MDGAPPATASLHKEERALAAALGRPRWLPPYVARAARPLPTEKVGGLTSLAQMIERFFGDEFFGFANDLMRWQGILAQMPPDAVADSFTCEPIIEGLDKIVRGCRQADLQFSGALASRAAQEIRSGRATSGDVRSRLAALGERLEDELGSQYFLLVDRAGSNAFREKHDPEDLEFLVAFDCAYDFDEARKCMALDRSTACAMHCMRVIEVGLKALCQRLGVDIVRYRNWGELIREMSKAVAGMDRTRQAPFHEAQIHLAAIKDVWRNETMHAARQYNSAEAATILSATRTFMHHMANLSR